MAKRYNVSIPDALAERLEPHKDKISLSAIMQAALERELAQLSLSDEDRQRHANLRSVAASAWMKRNPFIVRALGEFIKDLIDKAMNDGIPDVFQYYRDLYINCRREELAKKISDSENRYSHWLGPKSFEPHKREEKALEAIDYSACERQTMDFDADFGRFIEEQANKDDPRALGIPYNMLDKISDERYEVSNEACRVIESQTTHELALRIMEEQLKPHLTEAEIDSFILDFETAFAEMEE